MGNLQNIRGLKKGIKGSKKYQNFRDHALHPNTSFDMNNMQTKRFKQFWNVFS